MSAEAVPNRSFLDLRDSALSNDDAAAATAATAGTLALHKPAPERAVSFDVDNAAAAIVDVDNYDDDARRSIGSQFESVTGDDALNHNHQTTTTTTAAATAATAGDIALVSAADAAAAAAAAADANAAAAVALMAVYNSNNADVAVRSVDHLPPSEDGAVPVLLTAAPKERFYRKRKYWYWCIGLTLVLLAILIPLIIFVIFPAVAQSSINKSKMSFKSADITNPQETSMEMEFVSELTDTGPFSATIQFVGPVNITWNNLLLGKVNMPDAYVSGGSGTVKAKTTMTVANADVLGDFSTHMLNDKSFTWKLDGKVKVKALGLTTKELDLTKNVEIGGMDGLKNVKITKFDIPNDAPGGNGVVVKLSTDMQNPSPISIQLGTIDLKMLFNDYELGIVSADGATLGRAGTNLNLAGIIKRPSSGSSGSAVLSELFTNYVRNIPSNTSAVGVSVKPDGKNEVSWLSKGLKAMVLNVPLAPLTPMSLIKAIAIEDMNLEFQPSKPYAPVSSSKSIVAQYEMPFGFSLNMTQVANNMTIFRGDNEVVSLNAPFSNSRNDKNTIQFGLTNVTMNVADANRPHFDDFCTDLTMSSTVGFRVAGIATAKVDTPLGPLTLSGIPFNVNSSLGGLQGLNSAPPQISSLDVTDGTESGLNLDLALSMTNPAPISLTLNSDVTFQMVHAGADVGSVTLPQLKLANGENALSATSLFQPNNNQQGMDLLNRYVNKNPSTPVQIKGTLESINLPPLKNAISKLCIGASMPGLKKDIITGASLSVPWDAERTKSAGAGVEMSNPFKADLSVLSINSGIQSQGAAGSMLELGNADVDSSRGGWNSFSVPARSSATSNLPVALNLTPEPLISMLYFNAKERAQIDTSLFLGVLALGDYRVPGVPLESTRRALRKLEQDRAMGRARAIPRNLDLDRFNARTFVVDATKRLAADLNVKSYIQVGKYRTQINLIQSSVHVATDDSMRFLVAPVARPIVQKIVTNAAMGVESVFMHSAAETAAKVQMAGSISKSGPLSASFNFVDPMQVHWNNRAIGHVALDTIHNKANEGASFEQDAQMTITDVAHMTDFSGHMIEAADFAWTLRSRNMSITALGVEIADVGMNKSVTLKGMNGFKDAVTLTKFDMPGDVNHGQQQGIKLAIGTTMKNPSQVGLDMGVATLNVVDASTKTILGQISNDKLILKPLATADVALAGSLEPQTEGGKLLTVGELMNKYLSGKNQPVTSEGSRTVTGNSTASWLNAAFKKLSVNLELPGLKDFKVVESLELTTNAMKFTPDTAYAPATSANPVRANYKMPFPISLGVRKIRQNVTVSDGGVAFARLVTPDLAASNDDKTIVTSFEGVPFQVLPGSAARAAFEKFLADVTSGVEKTVHLSGEAVTNAMTGVGLLDLVVPIEVDTTFKGLQGLIVPHQPIVNGIDVVSGTKSVLNIKLDTNINNPSNVNLTVSNPAFFDLSYSGAKVGEVEMDVDIKMGDNHVFPTAHFHPAGAAIPTGLEFLTKYINGANTTGVMQGTTGSTDIPSLKQAFSKLHFESEVPGNKVKLISEASLRIEPPPAKPGTATAGFTMVNPFTAPLSIFKIKSNVTYKGIPLGSIDADLSSDPFVCAGKSNATRTGIPIKLNLNPKVLINFIRSAAADNGVDLGVVGQLLDLYPQEVPLLWNSDESTGVTLLDFIGKLGDIHDKHIGSGGNKDKVGGAIADLIGARTRPFAKRDQRDDITRIIIRAISGVKVDIVLDAGAAMDQYAVPISYSQNGVPLRVDETVIYLVELLGAPIVQNIVTRSVMTVDNVTMSDLQSTMFTAGIKGSVANAGPLDAIISFVGGVEVYSEDNDKLGSMALSDVNVYAGKGATLDDKATFAISDMAAFAKFTAKMMQAPNFNWTIKSEKVLVKALGFEFPNIKLTKQIPLLGFDGLNKVTITSFDLSQSSPGDDIQIKMGASLYNPSNIAIDLGSVQFDSFLGHDADVGKLVNLGRVRSESNMALKAKANNTVTMVGTLRPQSDSGALAKISDMFNNFLVGKSSDIEIKGVSVIPPGASSPPPWLQAPFSHLIIELSLPGYGQLPGQKPENIIRSITMNDLKMKFSVKDPWNGLSSSTSTDATFKLPFNIFVDISKVGIGVDIVNGGTIANHLEIPTRAVKNNGNTINMDFTDVKMVVPDAGHGAMQSFTRDLTMQESKTFHLSGKAASAVGTKIGVLNLNLPVDVDSTLKGLQGLKAKPPTVSNVEITGGTRDYLIMKLNTTLYNPSNIDLITDGTTQLNVATSATELGFVMIDNLRLKPGDNSYGAEMHLQPANAGAGQDFMNRYLMGETLNMNIHGSTSSTQIGPLQQAFAAVSLNAQVQGMNAKFIDYADSYLINDGANMQSNIFMLNPFGTRIHIVSIDTSEVYFNGDMIAMLPQPFRPPSPISIEAHGTGNLTVVLGPSESSMAAAASRNSTAGMTAALARHPAAVKSAPSGDAMLVDIKFSITAIVGNSAGNGYTSKPALTQKDVPNYLHI